MRRRGKRRRSRTRHIHVHHHSEKERRKKEDIWFKIEFGIPLLVYIIGGYLLFMYLNVTSNIAYFIMMAIATILAWKTHKKLNRLFDRISYFLNKK